MYIDAQKGHWFESWFAIPFHTIRYGTYRTVPAKSRYDLYIKNGSALQIIKKFLKKLYSKWYDIVQYHTIRFGSNSYLIHVKQFLIGRE